MAWAMIILELLALGLLAMVLAISRSSLTILIARAGRIDQIEARLIELERQLSRLVEPDQKDPADQ